MVRAFATAATLGAFTTATLAQSATTTPTHTIWLPMASSGTVDASVITAAPNWTVYALGCGTASSPAFPSACGLETAHNITEGPSTLAYSFSNNAAKLPGATGTPLSPTDLVTMNCRMDGGARASQAMCTGHSVIPGLGNGTDTTTLASSQLNYVPVTITAGVENLMRVAASSGTMGAGGEGSGESGGGDGGDGDGEGGGGGRSGSAGFVAGMASRAGFAGAALAGFVGVVVLL
ncbi:hypothetical protein D0864_03757 [Hortaea werneckii]|uniref:Ig-like domain-containing protein n=1 Tax=Hortaea werneckii TaxID=91943 RepID=A0A3M7GGM7_HORWE|nr:hypothetical protein D0864_03757 [Hortaea werneckii]